MAKRAKAPHDERLRRRLRWIRTAQAPPQARRRTRAAKGRKS